MSVVAAAIVNYQTPDLLEAAVRSFRQHEPDVPILVVDNGSQDDSPRLIAALAEELAGVEALLLDENIFHGPAMHRALQHLGQTYVLFLDSDTETRRGGFLAPMIAALEADPQAYGAGEVVQADRRGFAVRRGIPVLTSWHMLLKRDVYHQLPPFIHHGLPALRNFEGAQQAGYHLHAFPIDDYVHHLGRGTVARYGYSLGIRSKLDYLLHKLGL